MKILMIMQHVNFFRNLDTVLRELDARGHEVVMLHGTRMEDARTKKRIENKKKKEKMMFMGRGIEVAQSEISGMKVGYRPEPEEPWHRKLRFGRQVINRGLYFRKGHPSPERVTEGLEKDLPARTIKLMHTGLARAVLGRPSALRAWRRVEAASRPSPTIVALLKDISPDIVLVSPTIWPKRPVESDYIRAAKALGIPTIGYLNSWDNLTSKGTVHVLPDAYIVWNEALAEEAVELHDIPREIIRITGAPHLDRFFEMRPTVSREEARAQMGCPVEKPYLVYLCSSRTLMPSEVHVVTALAEALARHFPDGPPTLVVRPHPTNAGPWEDYARPGVVVYPKHGDQADCPEAWQDYYNQLSGACCFVGLNTTAFLEAAVADRPCLTIVADEFYGAQGKTGHFRHLLKADFLEVSSDATEVAARVARILDGADEKAEGRRFFKEWFLRPCGLERPATLGVTDVIEGMAPQRLPQSTPTAVTPEPEPELALATEDAKR